MKTITAARVFVTFAAGFVFCIAVKFVPLQP